MAVGRGSDDQPGTAHACPPTCPKQSVRAVPRQRPYQHPSRLLDDRSSGERVSSATSRRVGRLDPAASAQAAARRPDGWLDETRAGILVRGRSRSLRTWRRGSALRARSRASLPRGRGACRRGASARARRRRHPPARPRRASSGSGTPRPRRSRSSPRTTSSGTPQPEAIPGWKTAVESSPRLRVARSRPRRGADPDRDLARRALDRDLGRPVLRRHGLRLPRPDRGPPARGDQGRLHRDRVARAAHAAGRCLRRRADACSVTTSRSTRPGASASSR